MKINDFLGNGLINWEFVNSLDCFKKMAETPHSARWHKEGNPLIHTKRVLANFSKTFVEMADYFAQNYRVNLSFDDYRIGVMGALFHDLGKTNTTYFDEKQNDYCCKNHGAEGAKLVRELFRDENPIVRERICWLVRHHMDMHYLIQKGEDFAIKKIRDLAASRADYAIIRALQLADHLGSENDETAKINEVNEAIKALEKKALSPLNITVMIGVAGSGKSTMAQWIASQSGMPILCRDTIRSEMGLQGDKPMGTKEQEDEVTRIFEERFIEYCKSNTSFIIDNTNLKRKYRDRFHELAKPYNAHFYYQVTECPLNVCISRREGMIKESVIKRMWDEFEYPEPCESERIVYTPTYNPNEGMPMLD